MIFKIHAVMPLTRNEKSSLNESFRLECRLCALSYDTMSQVTLIKDCSAMD